MKLRSLIVLLSLFAFGGCTPKMIVMLDGAPLPDYAYSLKNPATGLSIDVVAAKYVNAEEDGEPFLWPVYFSVNEMYEVEPDNTRFIKITVIVRNPNKVRYAISESCITEPVIGGGKTNISTKGIYKGHLSFKRFELFYTPANNVMRKHSILVESSKPLIRMEIGRFSYKVLHKDSVENEGG